MKRFFPLAAALILILALAGCKSMAGRSGPSGTDAGSAASSAGTASSPQTSAAPSQAASAAAEAEPARELTVQFGTEGAPFTMYLEDNATAAAIAGYVGTSDWRLPIYNYDESDVMQYYDIPSRYEIPDGSEAVTEAHAGDVFYSDPNRIVLYYGDAQISERYTKIGTFDATEGFRAAVENNPVQEGWGNKLVLISAAE